MTLKYNSYVDHSYNKVLWGNHTLGEQYTNFKLRREDLG